MRKTASVVMKWRVITIFMDDGNTNNERSGAILNTPAIEVSPNILSFLRKILYLSHCETACKFIKLS